MNSGARAVKRGWTFDPECSRATHRRQTATAILKTLGAEATYPEHDPKCIKHPDNRFQRSPSYNYYCECSRGNDPEPTWPEWVTDEMFELAYRLADEAQTRRGDWHKAEIARVGREGNYRPSPVRKTDREVLQDISDAHEDDYRPSQRY